jgi:hypothetical protein
MNRKELVEFLTENYEPDDVLIWQTICKNDLEEMLGFSIEDDKWETFVEENHSYLAEAMSFETKEMGFSEFEDEDED